MDRLLTRLRSMMPRPSLGSARPFLAGGLTIVFLFSNVVALYAQEQNFWAARRTAARRIQPPESEGIDLGDEGRTLLSQLPQATRMEIGSMGGAASVAAGVKTTSGISGSSKDWLGRLVSPHGWVRDVYLSPKAGAPTVIHIQDAHGIEEAQRHIAAMLDTLMRERRINLVGLEGAAGAFSLDPFRNYPDAAITKDIADFLLVKGLIAGPEFAGLTAAQSPVFLGAEDAQLYEGNVRALKTAYKHKTALLAALATLRGASLPLKKTHFSPTLKTFDQHFEAYKAQREKLGDYVRYLVGTPRGRAARLETPNVHLLLNALEWEETLDFKEVEAERQRLVEVLVRRLSRPALEELIARSVDYRAGRLGYGDYNRRLRDLCAANKIRLEDYGPLSSYITYVLLAEKINRNELLAELDFLETAVQDALAQSPEEQTVMGVARDMALVEKLLRHEMAMPDWLKYEKRRPDVLGLRDRLAGLDPTVAKLPPLTAEALKPFEDFCSYAVRRNDALVANLTAKMTAAGSSSGVLVAGGFHTDGLTALLRQKQISYVVVTPKISEVPEDSDYLDILARDPVPLEKLVAGDRIYLSRPVALAGSGETPGLLRAAQDVLQNGVQRAAASDGLSVEPCDGKHGPLDMHAAIGEAHAVDLVRRAGNPLATAGTWVAAIGARLAGGLTAALRSTRSAFAVPALRSAAARWANDILSAPVRERTLVMDPARFLSAHEWAAHPAARALGWVGVSFLAAGALGLLSLGPGLVFAAAGLAAPTATGLGLLAGAAAARLRPDWALTAAVLPHGVWNTVARAVNAPLSAFGLPAAARLPVLSMSPEQARLLEMLAKLPEPQKARLREYVDFVSGLKPIPHQRPTAPEQLAAVGRDLEAQAIDAARRLGNIRDVFNYLLQFGAYPGRDLDVSVLTQISLVTLNQSIQAWSELKRLRSLDGATYIPAENLENRFLEILAYEPIPIDLRRTWANRLLEASEDEEWTGPLILRALDPALARERPEVADILIGDIPTKAADAAGGPVPYLMGFLDTFKDRDQRLSYLLMRLFPRVPGFLDAVFDRPDLSEKTRLYAGHLLLTVGGGDFVRRLAEEDRTEEFSARLAELSEEVQRSFSGQLKLEGANSFDRVLDAMRRRQEADDLVKSNDQRVKNWYTNPWLQEEDLKVYLTASVVLARRRLGFDALTPLVRHMQSAVAGTRLYNFSDRAHSGMHFGGELFQSLFGRGGYSSQALLLIMEHEINHNVLSYDAHFTSRADDADADLASKVAHEFLSDIASGAVGMERRINMSHITLRAYQDLHDGNAHGIARLQISELSQALDGFDALKLLKTGYELLRGDGPAPTSSRALFAEIIGRYLELPRSVIDQLKSGEKPVISRETIQAVRDGRPLEEGTVVPPEITGPTTLSADSPPHRLRQFPARLLLADEHAVFLRVEGDALIAVGPDGKTTRVPAGEALSIGRLPDLNVAALEVNPPHSRVVSRKHVWIRWDGQTATIVNASPNGTSVALGDPLPEQIDKSITAALRSEIGALTSGKTVQVDLQVFTRGDSVRVYRDQEAIPHREIEGYEIFEVTVNARLGADQTIAYTVDRLRNPMGSKIESLGTVFQGREGTVDLSADLEQARRARMRVFNEFAAAMRSLGKARNADELENLVYTLGAHAAVIVEDDFARKNLPFDADYLRALVAAWQNVRATAVIGGRGNDARTAFVPRRDLPFPIVVKDIHLIVEPGPGEELSLLLPTGKRLSGKSIAFGRSDMGLTPMSGVSSKQFVVTVVGSDIAVIDEHSTNGTLVPTATAAPRGPPAATMPGLVPLIGRLYGLNPANPADLDRIVNDKAPLVESLATGVFFYAAVGLLGALGSFLGVPIDHAFFAATGLFGLVNLAFGASHRHVYRYERLPGARSGRWVIDADADGNPRRAPWSTRLNLALRGMLIHSPLLLAFMDPFGGLFLAPLGAAAAVALHIVHNRAARDLGWSALTAADREMGPPSNARRLLKMSLEEFLQEYSEEGYLRPGYFGMNAPAIRARLDEWFGPEGWEIQHLINGELVDESKAFELYEEGYYQYFKSHPEELDRLVAMASDVYDTAPSNIESGDNYFKQGDTPARHLQDIAIRRVVRRLGRRFEGSEPIQVRGRGTPGVQWAPGNIPFHRPELIVQPEMRNWWKPGSVESFYQATKVITLRPHPTAARLYEKIMRFAGKERLFSLKALASLPWALDTAHFPKDEQGKHRPFTEPEIQQVLNGLLTLLGQSGEVGTESFRRAREQLRGLLSTDNPSRDRVAVASHVDYVPYVLAHLEGTGEIPVFLARDALSMAEFTRYADRLIDRKTPMAIVYQPGMFTQTGRNERADDKQLTHILTTIGQIMEASYTETVAEGQMPYHQLGSKSGAALAAIEQKFNRKTAQAIESEEIFRDYARQIYQQFKSYGLPANRPLVVVDSFGSGKSSLFVKSVIEYFSAQERGGTGRAPEINVLLGRTNHITLSIPEIGDFYETGERREKSFLELHWPFQYAGVHDTKSFFPKFAVKTNASKLLALAYQSLSLYNQAIRYVRGDVPIQKKSPGTRLRFGRGPPAGTMPSLVPLIGRLYGLDPANPEDLNTIVTEKAPVVETALFGVFYFVGMFLVSQFDAIAGGLFGVSLGLDPAVFNAYSVFALFNLAFGTSHAHAYTFDGARWTVDRDAAGRPVPTPLAARLGLAVRGAVIHAPLLLPMVLPFSTPWLTLFGVAASIGLHLAHNGLARDRGWRALTAGSATDARFTRFNVSGRFQQGPEDKPSETARRLADLSTTAAEILSRIDKSTAAMLIDRLLRVRLLPGDLTDQFDISYVSEGSNKVVYSVRFHTSRKNVAQPLQLLFAFKKSKSGEAIDRSELETLKDIGGEGAPRFGMAVFDESPDGREVTQWYIEEFIDGRTLHDVKPHGAMDSSLLRRTVGVLFRIARRLEGRVPRDSTRRNFVVRKANGDVVMVDVGGGLYQVLGPAATAEEKTKFLFRTARNLGMVDDRTIHPMLLDAFIEEAGPEFLSDVRRFIAQRRSDLPDLLGADKVNNEWDIGRAYWNQLIRAVDEALTHHPALNAGSVKGAVGWWAPVVNGVIDRFPSLARSPGATFALIGLLESALILGVNFLLPFTGFAEGSSLLSDAALGLALFGAHYFGGILRYDPEGGRFVAGRADAGRALGAAAVASTTFVPLLMLDLFVTGGVSHWMTAAAAFAGAAAHALLNVRGSIVRWAADRGRAARSVAAAALFSLSVIGAPLVLAQAPLVTAPGEIPEAALERTRIARMNLAQLAPSDATLERARSLMDASNPLLRAAAERRGVKLADANTDADRRKLAWLLETTAAWRVDFSKVAGVVMTSDLPGLGYFNDLKKAGETDEAARRVVFLNRDNTALGLLMTYAHEGGHIVRANRQEAEADTLAEDSRIAASLHPDIDREAARWPETRERFGLPVDMPFHDTRTLGALTRVQTTPANAFWLRYNVVSAVAAYLLREAPTPELSSANHDAVKAELNRLAARASQSVSRIQAVQGVQTFRVTTENNRVVVLFTDARGRTFPVDTGIAAGRPADTPGPIDPGTRAGPRLRAAPAAGEEDFNRLARLALLETLLGARAQPFNFTLPTPASVEDYWSARTGEELKTEFLESSEETRLAGFEAALTLLANDRELGRNMLSRPERQRRFTEDTLKAAGERTAVEFGATLHVNLLDYPQWKESDQADMRVFLTGLVAAARPGTTILVAADAADPLPKIFSAAPRGVQVVVLTPSRVPALKDGAGRLVMSEVVGWINRWNAEGRGAPIARGTRVIARDASTLAKAEGFLVIGLQRLSEAIANDIAVMLEIMKQA